MLYVHNKNNYLWLKHNGGGYFCNSQKRCVSESDLELNNIRNEYPDLDTCILNCINYDISKYELQKKILFLQNPVPNDFIKKNKKQFDDFLTNNNKILETILFINTVYTVPKKDSTLAKYDTLGLLKYDMFNLFNTREVASMNVKILTDMLKDHNACITNERLLAFRICDQNLCEYTNNYEKLRKSSAYPMYEYFIKLYNYDNILSNIQHCIKQSKIRFVVVPLTIFHDQNMGHENAIVFDKNKKIIYHFESASNEINKEMIDFLKYVLQPFIVQGYSIIIKNDYICPLTAIQQDQISGFTCQTWAIYNIMMRILNPDKNYRTIMETTNKDSTLSALILMEFMFYIHTIYSTELKTYKSKYDVLDISPNEMFYDLPDTTRIKYYQIQYKIDILKEDITKLRSLEDDINQLISLEAITINQNSYNKIMNSAYKNIVVKYARNDQSFGNLIVDLVNKFKNSDKNEYNYHIRLMSPLLINPQLYSIMVIFSTFISIMKEDETYKEDIYPIMYQHLKINKPEDLKLIDDEMYKTYETYDTYVKHGHKYSSDVIAKVNDVNAIVNEVKQNINNTIDKLKKTITIDDIPSELSYEIKKYVYNQLDISNIPMKDVLNNIEIKILFLEDVISSTT